MVRRKEHIASNIASKFSGLQVTHVLYTLLLIATFALGYLFSRVQMLEGGKLGAGGGGTAVAGAETGGTAGAAQPAQVVDVAEGELPALGDEDAKVKIVQFSDLQCPFCRRFFEDAYPQIKKEYIDTGKVAMYFRHYPLSFHPMAIPAALGSECANDQGKFWEFHDKAYEDQAKQGQGTVEFTNDDIKRWASEIGLNTEEFNQCFDSKKHQDKVDKDFADGGAVSVDGTPSFFVNGNRLVGAQPFTAFKTLIDQELNK